MDVLWIDMTFGALTYVLLMFNASAMIFDLFLRHDRLDSPTGKNSRTLREAVGGFGLLGCAVFLKLFCGSSHSAGIRVFGFLIALAFLGNAYAGHFTAMLDVIPKYVLTSLF